MGGRQGRREEEREEAEEGGGQQQQQRRRRRSRRRSDENEDNGDALASSSSATGAFYRCASTRALDARFGDILNRIRDAEAALAAEVVKRLASSGSSGSRSSGFPLPSPPPAAAMSRAAAAAAEVDALCALALTARERGWSRPRVVKDPVLWLRGGELFFVFFVLKVAKRNGATLVGHRGRNATLTREKRFRPRHAPRADSGLFCARIEP